MTLDIPLHDGERILMLKPKDDHTLIVTTERLFVERDGAVTALTLDGHPHFPQAGHA